MTTALAGIGFDTTIRIEPWEDPVGDLLGVDPRSAYVERYWLPFLGPSTTWLLRHFAACLEESPTGCTLGVRETARALGLGERPGRHAPFLRCVGRAIDYSMATIRGPAHLALRRQLPPLPARLAARLPPKLARDHAELLSGTEQALPLDALAMRGRQLALSLLELGESVEEAERQLLRWRFDPALARRCSGWAASRHLPSRPSSAGLSVTEVAAGGQ